MSTQYSRRAGRVLGAPIAPADVPRSMADEAAECPRPAEPMPWAERVAVLVALALSAAMVIASVESLVR